MTTRSTPIARCSRTQVLIAEMLATMSMTQQLLQQSQVILGMTNAAPDGHAQNNEASDGVIDQIPVAQPGLHAADALDTLGRLAAALDVPLQSFLAEPTGGSAPPGPASTVDLEDARLIALFRVLPDRLSREKCLSLVQTFVVSQPGNRESRSDQDNLPQP